MGVLALSSAWVSALWPFLVATAVSVVVVPLTMLLARGIGAVDQPDADRRIHTTPTPRLGGLGLCAGFGVAIAIFGSSVPNRWAVVAVSAAITLAMAVDDIRHLPWWAKLLIELAAGAAVAAVGITITFFAIPGPHGSIVYELGWLAVPVTIAWVVGMQTSINLLDGSDGVAGGVVGIVAAVSLLAAINRLESPTDVQNGTIILSGALMGCCAGFLIFNLPPARVFMGDGGSHFLGVALAIITILGVAKVAVALSLLVPLIALGLPIGDVAFAIVRRSRAGRSPAEPD
ncbi:MAG: MraY family glycosyltransferase, partial [Candidatus Dormibacteria bacterium]